MHYKLLLDNHYHDVARNLEPNFEMKAYDLSDFKHKILHQT